ncbi:MAG: hypothetical protein DCC55_26150, partial [Chloroflexi bacterium]
MNPTINLPSYEELFGDLDFNKGDQARAVYSPAAYLADLLQLLDDKFEKHSLAQRRIGLKKIPLDAENTFTEVPYLDIVNEVLENTLGANVYENLRDTKKPTARYPFNLPFHLENEKVKRYLYYLGVPSEQLYKQFALQVDFNLVAREYLGLSDEEWTVITTAQPNEPAIRDFYHLDQLTPFDDLRKEVLTPVGSFLKITNLTGTALRELLFQNLSTRATDRESRSERTRASTFFIHHQLNGYVTLGDNEETLVWSDGTAPIPLEWFDRANRFVRLANKIKFSFADLDLILRTCCQHKLDPEAIQTIAIVKQLHDLYDLPVDVVCSFFAPLNTLGIGDEETPQDLFNQIFNVKFAPTDKKYIPGSAFIPEAYQGYEILSCTGDLLSLNNKEYRHRLGKALGLSDKALTSIVTQYRKKYASDKSATSLSGEGELGLRALSLLHRISKLVDVLDSSPAELFALLDILEKDPSIRKFNNFDLLIEHAVQQQDCYRILEEGGAAALWLVQLLFAATQWMHANDFTAEELNQILTGRYQSTTEQANNRAHKLKVLDDLYQQFRTVMLTPELFVSDRFTARASRVIHQILTENGAGLVSKQDKRLVRFDATMAADVAYQALTQLAVIHKEDFTQLGLEQRLLDKLFDNLIIHGYLQADGVLVEPRLPKSAADFTLSSDFSAQREALFTLIHEFYSDEDQEQAVSADGDALVEIALFPADLIALEELSEAQRNELYDNLIFNGYIDADGNLLRTDFFARAANVADFVVNADLGAVSAALFDHIMSQIKQFEQQPLQLDATVFADLALTQAEPDDLIENLKFNQYIDQANVFLDKSNLLAQNLDEFNLALPFYPQRRAILNALKVPIQEFKSKFYTFPKETFRELADTAVAQQVVDRLAVDFLRNNQVKEAQKSFFLDAENIGLFELGAPFSESDHAVIFDQIATILADQQTYQLPIAALDELEFDVYETAELIEVLTADGHLTDQLMLPADKISYVLNVNHALEFSIEAFEDYNKDIFFILHDVAKEMDAAIAEIVAKIEAQANSQESVLFDVLQDAFGVPVDLVKTICRYVLGGLDHVVEAFVLPILAVVDANDVVAKEPDNNKFNFAYKRIFQFALLAAKLGLNQAETEIIFRDQDLVEKFPEKLALPEEPQSIDRFDALLESPDGTIYLFKDARYWAYSAQNYTLLPAETHEIVSLAQRFAELTQIDAAFTDSNGTSFLVGRDQKRQSRYFYKEKDSRRWIEKAKTWGKVNSNFADPERIDTAFQDKEGKIYLFSGTQYIRYSNGSDTAAVDEGYPLTIADNWEKEGLNAYLPARFKEAIDASFQGLDEKTYLFQGNHYVSSDALSSELEIKAKWGRVRNNFQPAVRIDAAYTDGATYLLFAGDQVIAYHDSLENDGVCVLEGYPRRIEAYFGNLPAEFESGLEAAFRGLDGQIYLLKDGKTLTPAVTPLRTFSVKERWGVVTNKVQQTGKVDAAFVGLDGKTYLFSDDQYIRYSGTNYAQVDEGYPRLIAGDWGGLQKVDAVFVMDGKTYLFGTGADGKDVYVRYSTKDYSVQDEGYPREPHENWWNLPAKLVKEKATFAKIDAVFNGKDNRTYLFSGDQFVFFDNKHRWWSEPQALSTQWDSIPFGAVDAAFVGTDGKTYLFSGQQYIRYSTSNYSKIDDRYPNDIKTFWGNGVNNIAKTEKVDAVLVLESYELVGGVEKPQIYTYLFSGNQYFRYAGAQTTTVENGYPKYIATSLKQEPRFKNLTFSFENGIDAGLADQRSIYLFKDATCYVVSDALYKSYDLKQQKHLNFSKAGCAFLEDGALILEELGAVEAENRWYRYTALEGYTVEKTAVYPALLRTVPDKFRRGLNAVLKGVDKNTYLFKGGDCFNVLLNKEYPLAEEWGRARNNIYLNNTVDAAFVGRDKKTYLFSGDQFVVYSGNVYVGAEIDGHPKPIKDHWGGLNSVALAYVKDDKTYLFEKADSEGTFRYVCYSTADYTQPDADFPQTADLDFWQIPISYRNEGFTEVTAVLFEGDNMFLLGRERYLQFNDETGLWSYPRPLSRIWRDPQDRLSLPLEKRLTAGLKTAFTGADGATHFFSAEQYIRYFDHKFDEPDLIKNRWGLARNNFINHRRAKIDAAFVYQDKTTYLFSGDQYIRYSSTDYRFVDEGYPKPILNHLRQEEAFKHLPDAFEESLVDHIAQGRDPVFDAVITNGRNLYLLIENHCHVVSQSLTATYDLNRIGRVKNHLVDNNKVDAALVHGNYTYLFSGDQYVRYSNDDYETVDDGYPKTLASSFAGEVGLTHLDDAFHYGIDAALGTANGDMYLFKGKDYLKLDSADPKPQAINKYWGKVYNQFVADANDTTIDAAFISPNGCLYAFKDGQYIRYQASEQEFVDEGYPKLIRNNWGNLPPVFEQGIDGGFVFEGKTYLLKGNEYVRYSNADYQSIDPIYPQAFRYRWGAWADYLLTDIKTITRFKQLQDAYTTADGSLADFLNPTQGSLEAPYELLSALFGWDIDELKWLKRRNGFLSTANYLFEEQFQLELIIKLSEVFATADKMGAAPSDVFTNIWEKLYALRQVEQAAAALYRYLALKHGEKEWQVLCNQIHAELNVIKRDALVPAVIAQEPGIENARDLYERLLIDVEMGSQGVTSRVQEAIAATQLFFHRYFVNLEAVEVSGGKEEEVRQELKRWWKWMKNYRVWEANRKVFLYPENYIRPELRDTKTPAFKTLEEDLLQGEITAATVQRAYKKYLDEYTEVSRLTIAGGYVYDAPESTAPSRNLVLFGRTKTDPRRYYYRLAEFFSGQQDSALWSPWLKVNVQIDADKVYPVFAFHRVFVFWTKVEALTNPPASTAITSRTDGNTQTVASAVPPSFVVKIYYSFYNLNKEWVPAQTLTAEIPPASAIENLKLFVENSDKLITQGKVATHENIIINCSYTVHGAETNHAFRLTPELYTERADKPKFDNNGLTVFDHIFDEHVFDDTTVVMFSTLEKSSDGPWFSFDHKGGSFLCKPAVTPLAEDAWPQPLANNPDQLPAWNRIDAAFEWPAGQAYFFRNDSQEYIVSTALNDKQATRQRWGKVRNNIAETGIVDAATEIGGKIYLFSGNQYLTYSHGLKLADAGCPKSLADNHDQLPLWERVDAAFTASDGKTYFFRHDSQEYVVSTALNDKHATRQRWGKARSSEFTTVAAAFTAGNHTYLIDGNHYLRYQGDNYDTVEPGFPRAFTSVSDIPELTIARRASAIDPKRLTGAFYYQNILYFQYGQEEQFRQLEIKSGQAPNHQDFRAHLNEEPLTAVVVHDPRVYVFKRKAEGGVSFDTLCIYDINKAEWTHHSIKLVDGKRKKIAIDHALLGKNGKFYLFSGDQYMESADWLGLIQRNEDETVASIRWQPAAGSIADDWLRFSDLPNRIAETGIVDAA